MQKLSGFLKYFIALFALYGCKPIVHQLGTFGEVSLPSKWEQELNTYERYRSIQAMKLNPSERERSRPHWDKDLNDNELTFYFTKDAEDTMGGRRVPNILRISLFNPKKSMPDIQTYLTVLANKSFHHDGVGGLADRKFTRISDHLWKNETPTERAGLLGVSSITEYWYLLEDPVRKVRILLSTGSDYYSDEETLELLKEALISLKLHNPASYFDGPVPHFQPFYISEMGEPFISDNEIVSYDWDNQILYLERDPGDSGFRNATLGKEVLFRFEIISKISARLIKTPVAYKVLKDDRPALILRPSHDFVNGMGKPDVTQAQWKELMNEKLRQHFELLDKLN